jgi:NADH-quinone oxidoreductase subunit H
MRFGLFFLAEYLSVFGVSCLGTVLFLGGGAPLPFSDFPTGMLGSRMFSYVVVNLILVSVFALKVAGFVFLMFWIRATLPRMRVDRLMNFAWKYLVPMSIVNILAAAVWYECYLRSPRPFVLFGTPLQVAYMPMNWIISSLITSLILVPAFLAIVAINRRELPPEAIVASATLPPSGSRLPAAAR